MKNRPKNHRDYSTGGRSKQAIVSECNNIKFKELTLPVNKFEVVCGVGTLALAFHAQKVAAFSVYRTYLPLQYTALQKKVVNILEFLEDSFTYQSERTV